MTLILKTLIRLDQLVFLLLSKIQPCTKTHEDSRTIRFHKSKQPHPSHANETNRLKNDWTFHVNLHLLLFAALDNIECKHDSQHTKQKAHTQNRHTQRALEWGGSIISSTVMAYNTTSATLIHYVTKNLLFSTTRPENKHTATDRQTDRHTGMGTGTAHIETDIQKDRQTDRQTDIIQTQTHTQPDRHTDRCTDT